MTEDFGGGAFMHLTPSVLPLRSATGTMSPIFKERKWGRDNFLLLRNYDFHGYIIFPSPIREACPACPDAFYRGFARRSPALVRGLSGVLCGVEWGRLGGRSSRPAIPENAGRGIRDEGVSPRREGHACSGFKAPSDRHSNPPIWSHNIAKLPNRQKRMNCTR